MLIGLFGGSFDPIHTGHAMIANFVAQCNVVDEVWIMVSKKNPLKSHDTFATDCQRLEMATLVAKHGKGIKVTDIEMTMPSPSFTIDTLKKLQQLFPKHRFMIIIGSDSFLNFKAWKNEEEIRKDFGVVVYPRPGFSLPDNEPEGVIFLQGSPLYSVSSSLVREYVKSGWNIDYFVPVSVSEYIENHKLYK